MVELNKNLAELHQMLREKNMDAYYALRLAEPAKQAQLLALFIIFFEAYEACTISREPMLGKIKIAWWRERIEELASGTQSRPHPAILAFSKDFFSHQKLLNILDEFEKTIDGWQPKTYTEIALFISKTFGELFAICGQIYISNIAEEIGIAYGNLYLLRKVKANKNLFLQDEQIAKNAIENFSKNLELRTIGAQKTAFGIIINHYRKHENSKRWLLLLKLFFKAQKPL